MWIVKKSKVREADVAKADIKKKFKIIQYIGEKVSKSEGDSLKIELRDIKFKKLVLYISLNLIVNTTLMVPLYNKARYINHFCKPNCEVKLKMANMDKSIKNIKGMMN